MKIGINLVGITGDGSEDPTVQTSDNPRRRDWFHTKEVVMSQLVNCWEGHETSIYLTTYNHSDVDNMLTFYKPKKYKILERRGSYMALTVIESLKMLVDEDLDFIVTVRPDLFLYKKLSEYPVDFTKFNFLHKLEMWDGGEFDYDLMEKHRRMHKNYCMVFDGVFLFPKSMLNTFIQSTENLFYDDVWPGDIYSTMHNSWIHLRKFLDNSQMNFLFSDYRGSNADIGQTLKGVSFDEQHANGTTNGRCDEYFLCRDSEGNSSKYNVGQDWKEFVKYMRKQLSIG